MKIKGNTTWTPVAHRKPMLTNRLAGGRLGFLPAAAAAAPAAGGALMAGLVRWVLPWLAVSGGVALTSLVASKSLPNIPINQKNIGLASALMGGGGAAYFASEGLSEKYKPWAYAASVLGIASGLYFLFQEPPPPPPFPTTGGGTIQPLIPSAQQVPRVSPGWLSQALVLKLDPQQTFTGGTVRSMGVDQPYAFAIRNQDPNNTARFYAGLDIRDDDQKVLFKSQPDASVYTSKYIEIGPNGSQTYELLSPSQWFWLPQTVTVTVSLYRNRDEQTPFMESNSIPIKMVYPGGGIMG